MEQTQQEGSPRQTLRGTLLLFLRKPFLWE